MARILAVGERPLHAFQKKSTRGIKTANRDIELVASRLRLAEQDYEERHGPKA